jgi:chorismate synthase
MSSELGSRIKVQIFGQSHSTAIGVVIDGFPSGFKPDMEKIGLFMHRRAPGSSEITTKRHEKDEVQILSGIFDGFTVGAPICAIIENTDIRSSDYSQLRDIPRPGHSDYSAYSKYGKLHDIRGGGHFSGRLTAPLCFAGALCLQLLEEKGIAIGAHILSIADVYDDAFDTVNVGTADLKTLSGKDLTVINDEAGLRMKERIKAAAGEGDSLGGIIECAAVNVPAGIGEPMFDGIENRLAAAVFGIPAVKGIEFGAGFGAAMLKGSENNDEFFYSDGIVKTRTNNHGGVLGGISTGMPIIFRAAVKPTPSISREQNSVSLSNGSDTVLSVKGRHDPCIVPRAVPCIEAVTAIVLADFLI